MGGLLAISSHELALDWFDELILSKGVILVKGFLASETYSV